MTTEQREIKRTGDLSSILRSNDVDLVDIRIQSIDGMDISIIKHYQSVDIKEHLFSNNIMGRISILDAGNLTSELPLTGQEFVTFVFGTPGLPQLKKTFLIDKLSPKLNVGNEKTQTYDLHFISPCFLFSSTSKISEAYNGRISDTVENIFRNYITGNETTSFVGDDVPKIKVEPTLGTHNFIIPNWHPNPTINWLANQAVSEMYPDRANYIFYEDLDGFHFVSLTSLIHGPIRESYKSAVANEKDKLQEDYSKEHRNIKSEIIPKGYERIKDIKNGMYSSTILTHDIVTKEFSSSVYKYSDDFDSTKALNEFPLMPTSSNHFAKKQDSKQYFCPKHLGSYGGVTTNEEGGDILEHPDNFRQELHIQSHKSLLNQMQNYTIGFSVSGDSNRRVGDKVEVIVPSGKTESEGVHEIDYMISGNYLITKINHNITKNGHTMKLELSKDSHIQRMPDYIEYDEGQV